jgi:hypothetical protein
MPAGNRGRFRNTAFAATCAALLVALAAPAGAQSLALSYGLDAANAPQPARAVSLIDRCSGLTWAAAVAAACSALHAFTARMTSSATADAPAPVSADAAPAPRRVRVAGGYSAADAPPPRFELPTLGSPAEARVLRAASGDDAGGIDFNLRFGSRYRGTPSNNGFDVYKFSDVTAENRMQTNGVRNVGVELLVPFR